MKYTVKSTKAVTEDYIAETFTGGIDEAKEFLAQAEELGHKDCRLELAQGKWVAIARRLREKDVTIGVYEDKALADQAASQHDNARIETEASAEASSWCTVM